MSEQDQEKEAKDLPDRKRGTPGQEGWIEVSAAAEHNLKRIDPAIPRGSLTVITGLSGSGKSSLAFDTLYAEGQRRYIETFSSYVRSFLGGMERPEVDSIQGLSPVIAIEQKTVSKDPRSTVGTVTEVQDLLRLLYARVGTAYSYRSGEQMVRYTEEQVLDLVLDEFEGRKAIILAPLIKGRKGHYRELFERIMKQGFLRARVDGDIVDLSEGLRLDRYKIHDIELVVDRVSVKEKDRERIAASCKTAMKHGKGTMMVMDHEEGTVRHFSKTLMCPSTGMAYPDPEPNLFSFNSPYGACKRCGGLGVVEGLDREKLIPDPRKGIAEGGIEPLGKPGREWIAKQLEALLRKYDRDLHDPIGEYPEALLQKVLEGTQEELNIDTGVGVQKTSLSFEGVMRYLERNIKDGTSKKARKKRAAYTRWDVCPTCNGDRLCTEALHFRIDGVNIADLGKLSLEALKDRLERMEEGLQGDRALIAGEVLREIRQRLNFLLNVGLYYLTLDRPAKTLSGGEAQRIRLGTQIGSKLTGVLYILDEPSIGLHQRDNDRLIASLKELRDLGNTVVVVEHDRDTIMSADHVIDMGPGAGEKGGYVVAEGLPASITEQGTLTGEYLERKREIPVPEKRREGNGASLIVRGAEGHNLKSIDVEFPLGKFITVTGVSGSGKSSLIEGTVHPYLSDQLHLARKEYLPCRTIEGVGELDKVIAIDQAPIGRTPRSNAATYTGVFSDIRRFFAETPEARIRAYKPGRFSFNVKGGRCETCKGGGVRSIEMNFLPDVHVTCETCKGRRYDRETLEVRYKGRSISDVLDMTIQQASEFFKDIPSISVKLQTLNEVGLGYLQLGQPSTDLSGGEAQRVKLATELARKSTGNTFYILDEPTTGLHFEDIRMLIEVLDLLVDQGNSVIVIEHDPDMIKVADHIIDMGPEGGSEGGWIVGTGTPEELSSSGEGHTAPYLKEELQASRTKSQNHDA
ncbi:MAG: excinuclease ABC subunit UvrA [Flavobacteriales bacterium]